MAEAPEGPPRKTTTYNRFSTMASQNERYNTKDDEFFWLENIMRVAPHKLHSVPGPGPSTRFPLTSICSDSTERGQQSLTIEMAFNQVLLTGLFNARTSWAHVENGQIYTMIGNADCGGGNMNYFAFGLASPGVPPSCTNQYFFSTDDGVTLPTPSAPVAEQSNIAAINARIGTSDIPAYTAGTGGSPISIGYPLEGIKVFYNLPADSGGGTFRTFGIHDSSLFFNVTPIATSHARLVEYDRTSGTLLNSYTPWGTDSVTLSNINVTSDMVVLIADNATTSTSKIYKINRSNGTVASTIDLSSITPNQMFCVNDDLQYFLGVIQADGYTPFYYTNSTGDVVYVGKATGNVITPFSAGGYFNNGVHYFGGNGFGGFGVNIQKIAVDCPPIGGPVIATISTGSTVAAGASIDVTFGTILEPDSSDRIQLQVAPTGGKLGFSGATATFISTSSATHGTLPFTIPGGTTPGTYIFQLVTSGGTIFIANSNTFTVT